MDQDGRVTLSLEWRPTWLMSPQTPQEQCSSRIPTAVRRIPGGVFLPLLSLRGERGNCSPNRTLQRLHFLLRCGTQPDRHDPREVLRGPARWGERRRTAVQRRGRESIVKLGIVSCYWSDPELVLRCSMSVSSSI